MEKSLKQEFIDAGIKPEEIDTRYSDLYVVKNAISDKIIQSYKFKQTVTIFKSQVDNKFWYDIPFGDMDNYIERKKSQN